MRDVIFVLLTGAFFALTTLYVRACATVAGIGDNTPAPTSSAASQTADPETGVPA